MVFPYAERKFLKPSETKNFFFLWRENPLSYTVLLEEVPLLFSRQKKCRQKTWRMLGTFVDISIFKIPKIHGN